MKTAKVTWYKYIKLHSSKSHVIEILPNEITCIISDDDLLVLCDDLCK
jgi:hypothetical protein